MISKSVIRLSSSSRDRRLSMSSAIRKKVRMALAGRAGVVKQIAPARLLGTKGNPPRAERKRIAVTRVMEGKKRKLASRNSRRPLTPCALMGVRPYTPLTANSSGGRVRLMPWNQCQGPRNHSDGHARPSFLTKRIILTAPPR
jgi:hypothetical protein